MKKLNLVLAIVTAGHLAGCANFKTKQTDISYDADGKPERAITTVATAKTFFDSKSALTSFKANQTDKSQTASVGSLVQESSGTNVSANIDAVTRLLQTLK